MTRDAFNPTDTPVVIDAEGRTLAGLAHGPVDPDADEVQDAVGQGRLLLPVDEPQKPTGRKATTTQNQEG